MRCSNFTVKEPEAKYFETQIKVVDIFPIMQKCDKDCLEELE